MLSSDSIDWEKLTAPEFYSMLSTEERVFELADSLGLLRGELTCECGGVMLRRVSAHQRFGVQFVCFKSRSLCGRRRSILAGSWFENSRLSLCQGFYAICAYAMEASCKNFSFLTAVNSQRTVVDWRSYFRDICASVVDQQMETKIGGEGMTVEIDETLIFTRNSHRGRMLSNERTGSWVFGGICRETGEAFLVTVERRDSATLFSAICHNIAEGTWIISDCWPAYRNLDVGNSDIRL